MSISLYDTAIDTFRRGLGSLDAILSKAEAHAIAKVMIVPNRMRQGKAMTGSHLG